MELCGEEFLELALWAPITALRFDSAMTAKRRAGTTTIEQ
jgi:hypothetical protein